MSLLRKLFYIFQHEHKLFIWFDHSFLTLDWSYAWITFNNNLIDVSDFKFILFLPISDSKLCFKWEKYNSIGAIVRSVAIQVVEIDAPFLASTSEYIWLMDLTVIQDNSYMIRLYLIMISDILNKVPYELH